jgi:hypothetical protein
MGFFEAEQAINKLLRRTAMTLRIPKPMIYVKISLGQACLGSWLVGLELQGLVSFEVVRPLPPSVVLPPISTIQF